MILPPNLTISVKYSAPTMFIPYGSLGVVRPNGTVRLISPSQQQAIKRKAAMRRVGTGGTDGGPAA